MSYKEKLRLIEDIKNMNDYQFREYVTLTLVNLMDRVDNINSCHSASNR